MKRSELLIRADITQLNVVDKVETTLTFFKRKLR